MENLNLFLQPKKEVAVLPIENKTIVNSTKSDLSVMASRIIEAVDDGYSDPLDTLIMAKKGAYVFKGIIEGMEGKVPTPQKGLERLGCAISERTTGVKWYFDGCNDPVWVELNQQLQETAAKLKEREDWLKTFTKPTDVDDQADEDGVVTMEARRIFPPVKIGGQSIIISIK